MTAATHPWTFIDPAPECGRPWAHAARIPKLSEPVKASDWEHLDGRPVVSSDPIQCESCGRAAGSLDLAAMTVEANWRRREEPEPTRLLYPRGAVVSHWLPPMGSPGEVA